MKKILIALLSLAMLFSFAACDNSSNTPDDTEEPSGGEGTVTFSDENVKAAWTKVISSFQVNDDATAGFEGAIQDLLGYRSSAYVDLLDSTAVGTGYTVEVSDDYATLTVTRAVSDASAEGVYPAQEAKLVANGIVKTRASESAPVDVVFNDFTYTAKTYATIGDNVVAIDASVSADSLDVLAFCNEKGIDTFVHEQNLLIHGRPPVLIMGCGHKGVVNIMEKAARWNPKVCIGGFHLNVPATGKAVPKEVLDGIAEELEKYDTRFYTCHCTGQEAYEYLSGKMEIRYLHCGESLEIG